MNNTAPNPMLIDPEMQEIVDSFIIETKEILEKLDLNLVELEKSPSDKELLNDIFRSFHTIKGTAGFLGLDRLTKVTHRCEDILNKLRKGEAALSAPVMDAILDSYDKIKLLLESIETDKNEEIEIEDVVTKLNELIASIENKTELKNEQPSAKEKKKKSEVVQPELNIQSPSETKTSTAELQKNKTEQIIPLPANPETKPKQESTNKTDNTIRVDVQRLDDLLNIVSELVLGRNRLAQVNSEIGYEHEGHQLSRDLAEITKQIDLMTNELQLVVMKTRMIKIGKVFNRFPRVVRDLCKETKKQVELVIRGEETELDKTLIEEINDPLVHLVRNSMDHGIESPDDRTKAGKNPTGTITLSAEHEGNNIIISIEDDGKGIDPDIIREKAISKGLITKERAKELTRQDSLNLIFLPGFSTAEVVTNISGRGVGMDVVKTNVTKLRGIINIESNPGKGTRIVIKLPLTLAIIPGMIVKVKNHQLVIPLSSVVEVLRVHVEDIYSVNQREVIKTRESILPLLSVNELLETQSENENNFIWQYIVVVGIAEKKYGIKVDHLIGQKEVVLKSLGSYLGNVKGIAGSTILGDGTVVVILDIAELVHNYVE